MFRYYLRHVMLYELIHKKNNHTYQTSDTTNISIKTNIPDIKKNYTKLDTTLPTSSLTITDKYCMSLSNNPLRAILDCTIQVLIILKYYRTIIDVINIKNKFKNRYLLRKYLQHLIIYRRKNIFHNKTKVKLNFLYQNLSICRAKN